MKCSHVEVVFSNSRSTLDNSSDWINIMFFVSLTLVVTKLQCQHLRTVYRGIFGNPIQKLIAALCRQAIQVDDITILEFNRMTNLEKNDSNVINMFLFFNILNLQNLFALMKSHQRILICLLLTMKMRKLCKKAAGRTRGYWFRRAP